MEEEIEEVYNMPEDTKEEIISKIEALVWVIRCDWTDPRSDCILIAKLCDKLRKLEIW